MSQRTILCLLIALGCAWPAFAQDRPRFPTRNVQSARAISTGYTLIEAEALARAAKTTAGAVSAQPMTSFGDGWSGGSQLFWQPPSLDERNPATLTVTFNVPAPGTYSIRLGYTRAPDYSDVKLFIAGELERELTGYATTVSHSMTTLADRHLDSGPNELKLQVFQKRRESRGYFAGLDSIELLLIQPGTNRNLQTSTAASQGTSQQLPQQGLILGNSAKLAFAALDKNLNWQELGPIEGDFYESNPSVLFTWETAATGFAWRWQAATQPFPAESSLAPPGLVASKDVAESPFSIDFAHVPPLGAPDNVVPSAQAGGPLVAKQVTATKPGPLTFYLRLVPVVNDKVAGPPSNTVIVHYKSGDSPPLQAATGAANTENFKQQMLGYTISVVKYEPAKWPDQIGCVIVTENSYKLPPVSLYPARQEPYCPKLKEDHKDALYWVGEAFHGWFFAYDLGANYYNAAKEWIVDQVVGPIPCEWLGDDLESTCDAALHVVVDNAINAAMVSAGVPPTMPDLAQLQEAAKGDLIDSAVEFTCDQVQGTGDHECDALAKEALRKIYKEGLEAMIKDAKRGASEPDCDNAELAVNYEMLPCFTDYPGVKVKPAPGAVYVPPMVTLKVTRTSAPPSPYLACSLRMALHATNHFSGNSYVQGQKLPPKDIAGELYEPATAPISLLKQGESETIEVAFQKMRFFSIATNTSGPNGTLGEWGDLYWGSKGTLTVDTAGPLPKSMGGSLAPCSQQSAMKFDLPVAP